jgi:CubicO group peptidase (beta-lactamase class C family)
VATEALVYPEATWAARAPESVGLERAALDALARFAGGRGCVVRHGYQVYTWGDHTARGDVASAAKPWYAHFLFKAVADGRLPGLDTPAREYEPRLDELNPGLGWKDRQITFRHLANQTSCYGVREAPGTAFDYNDFQMALFWDTLFLRIYGATYDTVDAAVLHLLLTDPLGCEDTPTFMAHGTADRPGRLGISPRDFARFGLLYLRGGRWRGQQLIGHACVEQALHEPLALTLPRTTAMVAAMIPGQRSIGSTKVPCDLCDHEGSYSWLWWVNGITRTGVRRWADVPTDACACLGHANGQRGLAIIPSLDLVVAWNDTRLGELPEVPHPVGEMLRPLVATARDCMQSPPYCGTRLA